MCLRVFAASIVLAVLPSAAAAQAWNTPDVDSLVARAIARRGSVQADSGLKSFRARAHGFVFFLGQLGEGFGEPPRLVKSDQLALEVYWQAPGLSKQIIIGRRDRRDLPTEVAYHRDHLGIVQNNFGDQIRFGDGDEVKDVPHPLSPTGRDLYDFALADSLSIQLPDRTVRVYQVLVRPRDFNQPRVVGSLFADVESAEVVRFRFSFTPPAYLDNTLEDITVELDNGLWFGKYWLPRRQEVEIRRRTSWLDLPARGIIRGRWEIGSYEFNVDIPPSIFASAEPEIVFAPKAVRDSFPWETELDAAIDTAVGPVEKADLDAVRGELTRAAANHALTGLPKARLGFGSISDLVHVNRVEGLAVGFGFTNRSRKTSTESAIWAGYGFGDHRLKVRFSATRAIGRFTLEQRAGEYVRDVSDEPVISRITNSLLAQEQGYDFGDYYRMREVSLAFGRRSVGSTVMMGLSWEQARSVTVNARPARGAYRFNPALGGEPYLVGRVELGKRYGRATIALTSEVGSPQLKRFYGRIRAAVDMPVELGPLGLRLSGWAGAGSSRLPAHRPFVLGGRGTLPGEGFRQWGGRYAVLGRLDVTFPVPFIPIPLGAFGSTGNWAHGGLFMAAGGAGGSIPGAPWRPTDGIRPVAGATLEIFQDLLRAELGVGLRDRRLGLSVDVQKSFWPIL